MAKQGMYKIGDYAKKKSTHVERVLVNINIGICFINISVQFNFLIGREKKNKNRMSQQSMRYSKSEIRIKNSQYKNRDPLDKQNC